MDDLAPVSVVYDGLTHRVDPLVPFDIGREADLSISGNRFLHRRFLRISHEHDFWWLANIGTNIAATVSDPRTGAQAWLGPGTRMPLMFAQVTVIFTAGPCSYEFIIHNESPLWQENLPIFAATEGEATIGALPLTLSQRQLIVALAEPMLRGGSVVIRLPSNVEAAERLGWTMTRFNRKLDNVCDRLDRLGVEGMRGGLQERATNRRARLIEYAVTTGLVTAADLTLLGEPMAPADDDLDD